jgi:hypothetical protein
MLDWFRDTEKYLTCLTNPWQAMVYNASNSLRTDVVILGVLAIGCVAYVFGLAMRMLEP